MVAYVILKDYSATDQDGNESFKDEYLGIVKDLKTAMHVIEILADQKLDYAEMYPHGFYESVYETHYLQHDVCAYYIRYIYYDTDVLVCYHIRPVNLT